jgi:SRSO17 transposase
MGIFSGPRLPQAGTLPLPELADFLAPFLPPLGRLERRLACERYITGLLLEHPNKNCQTLAAVLPETSDQRLQEFLTRMSWDEAALNRQRVKTLLDLKSDGDGVLLLDDTGHPKKGEHSVGVAPQYCGCEGQVTNCQVVVTCVYAERTLCWPVDQQLYLPKGWVKDKARRRAAKVPKDIAFQTKVELALDLVDRADALGVSYACVAADCDYGDNPGFLDGLTARQKRYVVGVRKDLRVLSTPLASARRWRADALVGRLAPRRWKRLRWREGSRGWLVSAFCEVKCYRETQAGDYEWGRLIAEKTADGETKYYFSNLPEDVSLLVAVEYGKRRHWIEQYHEEAKGGLGWDQYQGRQWVGFHRHGVLVMLAFSFLVWLEWRQRQQKKTPGRRRRLFSPATRSATGAVASRAATDRGGDAAPRGLRNRPRRLPRPLFYGRNLTE